MFFYRLRVCLSRRVRRAVDVRRDAAASRDARAQHDVRQPQRRDVRHLAGQEVRLHVARFAQSEFPAGARLDLFEAAQKKLFVC